MDLTVRCFHLTSPGVVSAGSRLQPHHTCRSPRQLHRGDARRRAGIHARPQRRRQPWHGLPDDRTWQSRSPGCLPQDSDVRRRTQPHREPSHCRGRGVAEVCRSRRCKDPRELSSRHRPCWIGRRLVRLRDEPFNVVRRRLPVCVCETVCLPSRRPGDHLVQSVSPTRLTLLLELFTCWVVKCFVINYVMLQATCNKI